MKVGAMIRDVVRSLFRQPATREYPHERKQTPPRLRGQLHWDPSKCTGCLLCVKDCPAEAIEILTVDRQNKRFVMRYHLDRCTFCSQCVVSCRQGALQMSNEEWELAARNKDSFTICYGNDEDVRRLVEPIEPDTHPPENQ